MEGTTHIRHEASPHRGVFRTVCFVVVGVACGGRTELEGEPTDAGHDSQAESHAPNLPDTSAPSEAQDSTAEAPPDAAGRDTVAGDSPEEDTSAAIPPIDASLSDSAAKCPAGSDIGAYLVAQGGDFYAFNPSTFAVSRLGALSCAASVGASPFTMTVALSGAYILYSDGNLFHVDPTSLLCTQTPFAQNQLGFPSDIGIATSPDDGLLVYGCVGTPCTPTLAKGDWARFALSKIGPLIPTPTVGYPLDIKADAYGRLFACDAAGTLLSIDLATARVLGADRTGIQAGPANALLTWNDRLFMFTQAQGLITRYDLKSQQATMVGAVGDTIAGAGAAPCVP